MATDCNNTVNNKGYYPKVKGKKRKVAEELASPDFDGNITRLCERHNIARSTLYRWYDDMGFNGYVSYLITKYSDSELANAWRALVKKMKTGNVEALKLFFELKGLYKQQVKVSGDAVVFISGEEDIPD